MQPVALNTSPIPRSIEPHLEEVRGVFPGNCQERRVDDNESQLLGLG